MLLNVLYVGTTKTAHIALMPSSSHVQIIEGTVQVLNEQLYVAANGGMHSELKFYLYYVNTGRLTRRSAFSSCGYCFS